MTLSPIVICLFICLLRIIFWLFRLSQQKWYLLGNTIVSILLYQQPGVIRQLVGSLICIQLSDGSTTSYVYSELSITCSDTSYKTFIFAFVAPALLIWGVLLTAVPFFILYHNSHNRDHETVRNVFGGSLVNGYTQTCYLWGVLFIVFKILIVTISTVFVNSSLFNACLLLLIIYEYLALLNYFHPLSDEETFGQERRSARGYVMTIFLTFVYFSTSTAIVQGLCIAAIAFINAVIIIDLLRLIIMASFAKKDVQEELPPQDTGIALNEVSISVNTPSSNNLGERVIHKEAEDMLQEY
jgi:hypothetical protein